MDYPDPRPHDYEIVYWGLVLGAITGLLAILAK